jgi:hypothetical protein
VRKLKLNPNQTGLVVGAFIGLWHFVWGLVVVGGMATLILDFIYSIHFLSNPFLVQPFDVVKWITLIIVTAVFGYIVGYVFALLWNKLHK